MLFPTITFFIFFAVVFALYWGLGRQVAWRQNLILLGASYFFYGWWDLTFLGLLILVTAVNFLLGMKVSRIVQKPQRFPWLVCGLIFNLGVLIYFKYLNFFATQFVALLELFGIEASWLLVTILQPIGISFYIFLAISYLIDRYHDRIKSPVGVVPFALSISFFPILLAGPVHRPAWLLPQLDKPRGFEPSMAQSGLRQFLWGLFMKLIIADHFAQHADTIFGNPDAFSGSTLLLGLLFFTIQIYADFAGYSHMAIGIGKLLGIPIVNNFAYPYFASNIRLFWQRWNISLTRWFRDYVFLPVAYALSDRWKQTRLLGMATEKVIYFMAALVTWTLTGLWHGAGYTFLFWGLLHGIYLTGFHFGIKSRKKTLRRFSLASNQKVVQILEGSITLILVIFAWLFFRASDLSQAWHILQGITSPGLFAMPHFPGDSNLFNLLLVTIFFFGMEWYGRREACPLDWINKRWARGFRWAFYYALVLLILFFHPPPQPFIYFQF